MKRRTIKADEYDVVSAWRYLLAYTRRAGLTSGIKRRMRRRERHGAKHSLHREDT